MRNTLAFLAAATIVIVSVGWYRGWFQFTTQAGLDGHPKVTVDINPVKIRDDVRTGVQEGGAKLQEILKKDEADKDKAEKVEKKEKADKVEATASGAEMK